MGVNKIRQNIKLFATTFTNLQLFQIKAVLSEVFNRMDGLFITEDEIIRSFEIEMGKPLSVSIIN